MAVGMALADKMRGDNHVTCIFFGDGAVAEGEFHESLNLAALWNVPVLFVCENNRYGMGTALEYSHAVTDIAMRASCGYGIPAETVDGMDVLAVQEAATRAVEAIRAGEGPYFLECQTYRFRAHSMFDAELYRKKDEVQQWRQRDPIEIFIDKMKALDLLREGDLEEIEKEVAAEVQASVDFAEAGTWEPLEDLARFVYLEEETA
jgi:TPP-dependent pyruvate/acetoin dehydrogenase alpha subunit